MPWLRLKKDGGDGVSGPPSENTQNDNLFVEEPRWDRLLSAVALVMLDEINRIRTHAAINLPARTVSEMIAAIRKKLRGI